MDSTHSTKPMAALERAATARLLEAAVDALTDERLELDQTRFDHAVGFLVFALGRGALDIRRGHRGADLDATAAELRRRVEQLATGDTVA